jgi:hypothetical protein
MRNPVYEQALSRQGIKYQYIESLDLEAVSIQNSLHNQVRLKEAVLPELVKQYKIAYEVGDQFPPLLCHRVGRGKYTLLDGVNRYSAAIAAKLKEHDAYEVDSDTPQSALIRLRATFNNSVNGQRMDYDDLMWHAVQIVRTRILSAAQAAKECSVKYPELVTRIRELEAREFLDTQAVPHRNLQRDKILDLLPLKEAGTDLFTRACRIVNDTGASTEDCKDIVKAVKNAKTSDAKAKAINNWEESDRLARRRAETKGGTISVVKPPSEKFDKLLRDLNHILSNNADNALRASRKEYEAQHEIVATIADRLVAMYGLGPIPSRKAGAS